MVALQKAVDGNNYGNMKGYYPERSIPSSGPTRINPGVSTLIIAKSILNICNYIIYNTKTFLFKFIYLRYVCIIDAKEF